MFFYKLTRDWSCFFHIIFMLNQFVFLMYSLSILQYGGKFKTLITLFSAMPILFSKIFDHKIFLLHIFNTLFVTYGLVPSTYN